MPRRPRIQPAGGTFHVFARGVRKETLFRDDEDRAYFLNLVGVVVRRYGWRVLAYCVMDNHFHLLVETPEPNLSGGMQRLKGDYATYFNERHSLVGHLFQQRFASRLIESEEYLGEVLRYIAFNPVRAGLCAHPSEWPWSSFHGAVDLVLDR